MVDRSLEADQVRLFIKKIQLAYMQHFRFMLFEIFSTLSNMGMVVEEESANKHLQRLEQVRRKLPEQGYEGYQL